LDELLRTKAMSLYVLGRYTPIISVLCLKIIELLSHLDKHRFEVTNFYWDMTMIEIMKTVSIKPEIITEENRVLYFQRFNLPVHYQLDFEKYYRSCTTIEQLLIVDPIGSARVPRFVLF